MADQGVFGSLQKGLADAITDIREKVVEEPMWGRSLSDSGDKPLWQPDGQEPEHSERSAHPLAEMQKAQGIWQEKGDQAKPDRDQKDIGIDR